MVSALAKRRSARLAIAGGSSKRKRTSKVVALTLDSDVSIRQVAVRPNRLAALIFCTSAAALIFQVAQTRLFSASFGYHLTYLVLSISLLGVGIGSTCSVLLDRRPSRPSVGLLGLALGAAALFALFAETHVNPAGDGLWLAIVVAFVLGSLPFVFASWIVVRSLNAEPARAGSLYAMDLAGAAMGSLVAFGGISVIGVPALYAAAAALAAAGAAAVDSRRWLRAIALLPLIALVALAGWSETLTPPTSGPNKADLSDPAVVREASRWDPLARVDVLGPTRASAEGYEFLVDPAYAGPRPNSVSMLLDLGAATPILAAGDDAVLHATIIAAPYTLLDRPTVMVIGPGGGIDVRTALAHGADRVEAVEVNRGVIDDMRGQFAAYSGGLYADPRVQVHADEARSFIRRSTEHYDLIVMTVVDSYAALASGAYALTETYLYTEEALTDYLAHLQPGGMLAIGRWYRDPPIEMTRTVQVAARGLRAAGVSDPARNILVLRHRNFGLLLVREKAFDAPAVATVRRFTAAHGFSVGYDPQAPSDPFARALIDEQARPATDDHPFFFANDPTDGGVAGDIPVAHIILFVAFGLALILSYAGMLLPLRLLLRGRFGAPAARRQLTVSAAALGLGFIAAEIVLIQRLTLYLGQPALALSVGLAGLLVGAAAGSALSGRARPSVPRAALTSALLLALVLVGLPVLGEWTLAWPIAGRLLVAVVGTALAGLPLGAVFPQLIRQAGAEQPALVSWIWAVNATASVLGAILAAGLAMTFGFTVVAAYAVACYLAVYAVSLGRRDLMAPTPG